MNKAILLGNATKSPEIHTTQGGIKKANFTLAVQRRVPNAQGVREADFITIVAWRQLADFCEKYVIKGTRLLIEGYIQVRDYNTQDGQRRTVTEIVADSIEFPAPKEKTAGTPEPAKTEMAEAPDPELPF